MSNTSTKHPHTANTEKIQPVIAIWWTLMALDWGFIWRELDGTASRNT